MAQEHFAASSPLLIAFRLAFGVLVLVTVGAQLSIHLTARYNAVNFFSYFTNLSNSIAALVFLAGVARQLTRRLPNSVSDALRTASVINMAVVGVVFAVLLRNVNLGDLRPWVNTVVHQVMPVAVFIEYLSWPPRRQATASQLGITLCFPVAYLLYVFTRGASTGWYPYPFLNPITMNGYAAIVPYVAGIVLLFVALAWLLTRLSSRIAATRKSAAWAA